MASPEAQEDTGALGPAAGNGIGGAQAGVGVTLDLDPGLGVTQGPDVDHHVHATRGKMLVVW